MVELVCGIWRLDGGEPDADAFAAMLRVGPRPNLCRNVSIYREKGLVIGRLRYPVEENSETRLKLEDGKICIADARLFEPERLIERYSNGAAILDDNERLLLEALQNDGIGALQYIQGDYAGVLWDVTTRTLTCFRDHVGARPFYYLYERGRHFAFASLAPMIMKSGLIKPELQWCEILNQLVAQEFSPMKTQVRHLMRLPPAHAMVLDGDQLELKRFWRLKSIDPISPREPFENHARQLRDIIDRAIKKRLDTAQHIGADLSGGLDSSTVTALAARQLKQQGARLETFSLLPEKRNDVSILDERQAIQLLRQREPSINNTEVYPARLRFDAQDMDAMDQPLSGDPGTPQRKIAAQANRLGIDLILTGWGGDEVVSFNGRGAFAEFFLKLKWLTLYREGQAFIRERQWTWGSILKAQMAPCLLPEWAFSLVRRLRGNKAHSAGEKLRSYLHPEWRSNIKRSRIGRKPDTRANKVDLFNHGATSENCEILAHYGAEDGVAFSYPLMDVDVLEYAVRFPAEFHLRKGFRRAIFRQAMEDLLPDTIRLRHVAIAPESCILLRLAEKKSDLLQAVSALRDKEKARELFDLDAIEGDIRKLPSDNEAKKLYIAEANGGDAVQLDGVTVMHAVIFANYVANLAEREGELEENSVSEGAAP